MFFSQKKHHLEVFVLTICSTDSFTQIRRYKKKPKTKKKLHFSLLIQLMGQKRMSVRQLLTVCLRNSRPAISLALCKVFHVGDAE